ncbi:MAG: fatty acid desaturase [Saprospiraceae bacterium]
MRTLGLINDPVYRETAHSGLDQFFIGFLKDKRDLPFIYLIIRILVIHIPLAAALFFLTGTTWWIAAAVYTILVILAAGPFTLMLHNTSHRVLFKREYKWANRLIPWALCPFVGQSPDTYFSHHIGMHHAENNMHEDLSSTLRFQRDSFVDFLRYFGRFIMIGIWELIYYFQKRSKRKLMRRALIGELGFYAFIGTLLYLNPLPAFLIFIVPVLLVRFFMMAGNWAQHAFIDAATPENNYRNSITCINNDYNKKCFNDGYHIGHHLRPHMHWTDMPNDFLKNAQEYARQKAVVFEGLDYNQIWFYLVTKNYGRLADHFVNINGSYGTKEEVMALLRERTKRIEG